MSHNITDPHIAKAMADQPDFIWLNAADLPAIQRVLTEAGLTKPNESVTAATKAGEGNMNLTLRVTLQNKNAHWAPRTLIVKQSRPWVEKYPMIAAPTERSAVECGFYKQIQSNSTIAERMPRLIGGLAKANTIVLEDLGEAADFTGLYQGDSISDSQLHGLMDYLSTLHTSTHGLSDPSLLNLEMRRLNHEHIFVLPFRTNNGVDFDAIETGLSTAAETLHNDFAALLQVNQLGKRYLAPPSDNDCLLHGDYFPGSWLRTTQSCSDQKIFVIDPEFCFLGPPAFDLAITVAHLIMAGATQQIASAMDAYKNQQPKINLDLMAQFAAVEVLRRNLGVAQLPLTGPKGFRTKLVTGAHHALTTENHEEAIDALCDSAPIR